MFFPFLVSLSIMFSLFKSLFLFLCYSLHLSTEASPRGALHAADCYQSHRQPSVWEEACGRSVHGPVAGGVSVHPGGGTSGGGGGGGWGMETYVRLMITNTSSKEARLRINVSFCCVFVRVGETPQSICGDVFIDIGDEEPLVPDQVKPSCH